MIRYVYGVVVVTVACLAAGCSTLSCVTPCSCTDSCAVPELCDAPGFCAASGQCQTQGHCTGPGLISGGHGRLCRVGVKGLFGHLFGASTVLAEEPLPAPPAVARFHPVPTRPVFEPTYDLPSATVVDPPALLQAH